MSILSGCILKYTDGDSHDKEDLMLAAEIGKSLLERNRELEATLKVTQEYAEEQCAQVQFYMKQIEILRDENETSYHTYEQLEGNNQSLSDKCDQWEAEFKILEGKNSRLWEVINSLEKRIEELTSEIDILKKDILEMTREEDNYTDGQYGNNSEVYLDKFVLNVKDLPTSPAYELEHESLRKQISELNIQVKLGKLQKGEIECQLEDIANENQILYNKISSLNQEINEWENFAQKEDNYRRLAAAFTLRHCIETESDVGNIFEKKLQETPLPKKTMARAKSCECLNYNDQNVEFLRSPNLVNNILSSVNSSSFLSELDTEYAELVKRYEALLEKFKQEGKLTENPERVRKVQKAIQTLSLDFTNIPTISTPLTSPTKKEKILFDTGIYNETTPVKRLTSISCSTQNSSNDSLVDYQMMFSEIFAKIKESKEGFI